MPDEQSPQAKKRTRSRLAQLADRAEFDIRLAIDAAAALELPHSLVSRLQRARTEVIAVQGQLKRDRSSEKGTRV